jgi:hypothetical protein
MFMNRRSAKVGKRFPASAARRLGARLGLHVLEDRTLPSFSAPVSLPTGVDPQAVAVGDFNGDHAADLAVANQGFSDGTGSGMSIVRGKGDGTFQTVGTLSVGGGPLAVAVGDFDGNGSLDLAVTYTSDGGASGAVAIFLGNGDGTFRPPTSFPVGADPRAVAVGDFNGDARLDVATANTADGTVSVLWGNGDGTLQAALTFPVGPNPVGLAVADLAGNGRLALVTGNEGDAQGSGGGVSILLGNGDGTFQAAVSYGLGHAGPRPAARGVAVADFNADGVPDLVTANDSDKGGTVSLLLGNGDGTFRRAVTFPVDLTPFSNPLSLVAGDFTGDGRADVVVGNAFLQGGQGVKDQLFVFAGTGTGSFSAPVAHDAGALPVALAAGDFDTGGRADDLAITNSAGGDVTILLGHGDGTFDSAPSFAAGSQAFAIAPIPLGRTGNLGLVTANFLGDSVSVLRGNGHGSFLAAVNYPVGHGPGAVAVGDLNGDGVADVVTANTLGASLSLLLGNRDGTFRPAQTITTGITPFFPEDVSLADFNGDHVPDLAVSYEGSGGFAGLVALRGNGDGTFFKVQNLLSQAFVNPKHLVIADLNGDGIPDLAQAVEDVNSTGELGGAQAFLGIGDGTFHFVSFTPTSEAPTGLAAGDFNSDGVADLALTNFLTQSVSVLRGKGDGSFQAAVTFSAGVNSRSVLARDFNGDGVLDLALANSTDNSVSVLSGKGDGMFGPEVRYLAGSGTDAVAAGDFNGDGAPDLVTANGASNSASVLLNRNDGTGPAAGAGARSAGERGGTAQAPATPGALPGISAPAPAAVPSAPLTQEGHAVPAVIEPVDRPPVRARRRFTGPMATERDPTVHPGLSRTDPLAIRLSE